MIEFVKGPSLRGAFGRGCMMVVVIVWFVGGIVSVTPPLSNLRMPLSYLRKYRLPCLAGCVPYKKLSCVAWFVSGSFRAKGSPLFLNLWAGMKLISLFLTQNTRHLSTEKAFSFPWNLSNPSASSSTTVTRKAFPSGLITTRLWHITQASLSSGLLK